MKLFRKGPFLAAVALTTLVALYFAFVAQRAVWFLQSTSVTGKALGAALIVLPLIGVWYLANEWRLGATVQAMANRLDAQDRLPLHDGARTASGRLTDEAAQAVYEVAARGVEEAPNDWAAWFHLGFAYDAAGERALARTSLRHAADLYRRRGVS